MNDDFLLSVQCISSIGQIIKSVCLCVSQSVSESVTRNKLNALRSTDRNPPPIFTKLATKVGFRVMWLRVVFVEIEKTLVRQSESGINFHRRFYGKIVLM